MKNREQLIEEAFELVLSEQSRLMEMASQMRAYIDTPPAEFLAEMEACAASVEKAKEDYHKLVNQP